MSREIKFRAWNPRTKEMYLPEMVFINDESDGGSASLLTTISGLQENFKLMQFTGMHDRNGKEIYEGDVIKTTLYEISECLWEVYFGTWCYMKKNPIRSSFSFDVVEARTCEVVGNIYENPDLSK